MNGPAGCYGKLPARADFIARRLARTTVEPWDRWMQACLAHSQQVLAAAWQDHYLTAPPWRLVLPAGACGPTALIGVLVPSVDAVGRCFPFLIAQELGDELAPALSTHFRATDTALEQLWDEPSGQYYSRNAVTGALIKVPTVATFLPLWTGIPSRARA